MVSRDQGRVQAQAALARHLLATGLGRTSLRELAAAAGISDRMVLYYFKDKAEALSAAVAVVAAQLATQLGAAVPAGTRLSAPALLAEAVAFTTQPVARPAMRLWIELVAAAARAEAPYPAIARQIADGFIDWTESRLDPAGHDDPRATAAAIIAMVDGLAVVAVCADADLVERAAARLIKLI